MKRGNLQRRTALRNRPKKRDNSAQRVEWKKPQAGWCECGCSAFGMHLHRHHIVLEQIVRREGGNVWDLDNSMLLVPSHHARHHSAERKIPIEYVPPVAIKFAIALLGEGAAAEYFERRYGCARD